jgi:uncharacterized protein (TIGR02996 family)
MEEEAFLRAISAAPADSTVRLVYADWLDERGGPRGELVRLQVRLREVPPEDPARTQLQAREKELRAGCPAHWLAKFDPPLWRAVGESLEALLAGLEPLLCGCNYQVFLRAYRVSCVFGAPAELWTALV